MRLLPTRGREPTPIHGECGSYSAHSTGMNCLSNSPGGLPWKGPDSPRGRRRPSCLGHIERETGKTIQFGEAVAARPLLNLIHRVHKLKQDNSARGRNEWLDERRGEHRQAVERQDNRACRELAADSPDQAGGLAGANSASIAGIIHTLGRC